MAMHPGGRGRPRRARLVRRRSVRRVLGGRAHVARAKSLLGRFRRASLLALALTSLLLLVVDAPEVGAQVPGPDAAADVATEDSAARTNQSDSPDLGGESRPSQKADEVAKATGDEAKRAYDELKQAGLRHLPKFVIVAGLLLFAWLLVRAFRFAFKRVLGTWPRATAVLALSGITVWVLAVAGSVMVIAGDVRAFLGSVGLLGLAASWALQTPIESFTGWLLNAFRGYYRVGDRIEVGDVFGDVQRIDVLTTTVWEIGSPFRPGFVRAEQATGRLITFPNNQILTGSVINLTRDFQFVWDELSVTVANESDLRYASGVLEAAAVELLSEGMQDAAREYEHILRRAGVQESVPELPQVFVSIEEAWTSLHVRYLVHARKRRHTKSELVLRLQDVLNEPQHKRRIIPVIPRQQLQLIGADGLVRNATWFVPNEENE